MTTAFTKLKFKTPTIFRKIHTTGNCCAATDSVGIDGFVVGKIVQIHLDDSVLDAEGWADPALLDLIGRLGGSSYCRTTERFEISRPSIP